MLLDNWIKFVIAKKDSADENGIIHHILDYSLVQR